MVSVQIFALGAALAFVFGWNNSSFLIGNGAGSGSLTLREALIVSSVGLFLGVVLEGPQMLKSLGGSITPAAPIEVAEAALAVSLLLTVGLSLAKLPVSFSMAMVGAFSGAALAASLKLNGARLEEIVGFWFLAPLLAAALAYALYALILRGAPRLSLLAVDGASRYGVILTSLVIAYVLGANNIGLIYGTMVNGGETSDVQLVTIVLFAILVSQTVGDRLLALSPFGVIATFVSSAVLIWLGTQLAIPVSISQCLLGGMFGAALTNHISAINGRVALRSVASWLVVPVAALALGFALIYL
jgi:PiT family inorganic phosphate transporter